MNGKDHILDEHDVKNLVEAVETFVSYVESQKLRKIFPPNGETRLLA
jgi:hypothetical protein